MKTTSNTIATTTNTAYRAYDAVTEWMSGAVDDPELADALAARHNAACAASGGFGSAIVVRRAATGRCETLDGEDVWPPHGRGDGTVRFDAFPPRPRGG